MVWVYCVVMFTLAQYLIQKLTQKSNILDYIEDHEVMADRGFAIQDLCAEKGVTFNRPKQKDVDQIFRIRYSAKF